MSRVNSYITHNNCACCEKRFLIFLCQPVETFPYFRVYSLHIKKKQLYRNCIGGNTRIKLTCTLCFQFYVNVTLHKKIKTLSLTSVGYINITRNVTTMCVTHTQEKTIRIRTRHGGYIYKRHLHGVKLDTFLENTTRKITYFQIGVMSSKCTQLLSRNCKINVIFILFCE